MGQLLYFREHSNEVDIESWSMHVFIYSFCLKIKLVREE